MGGEHWEGGAFSTQDRAPTLTTQCTQPIVSCCIVNIQVIREPKFSSIWKPYNNRSLLSCQTASSRSGSSRRGAHRANFPARAREKLAPKCGVRDRAACNVRSIFSCFWVTLQWFCRSQTLLLRSCGVTKNIIWYKNGLGLATCVRASNSVGNWFCCYLQTLHFGSVPPDV